MQEQNHLNRESQEANPQILDSATALYESDDFKSLDQQISSGPSSVPHLSGPTTQQTSRKSPSSKISRSISKLLRSMFRLKSASNKINRGHACSDLGFYGGGGGGLLPTIPEVWEKGIDSAGSSPLLKKTASERYNPTDFGISDV